MLRHPAHPFALLVGMVTVLAAALVTAQSPVAAMYGDDQVRNKAITLGFVTAAIPAASFPAAVYLTQGDLQRAFDASRFRPDGAFVPTNTDLQLTAPSPAA